jgi:hypothetical protein
MHEHKDVTLCAVQFANEDELLHLIHQGGLITLLKGCMDKKNPAHMDGPAASIQTLTALWTKKAAEVSRELYTRIEGKLVYYFMY